MEAVGRLNLPGIVIVRVVSSRNFSVQYTDGLECTQAWLRVREAGHRLPAPCSETELRAPPKHRHTDRLAGGRWGGETSGKGGNNVEMPKRGRSERDTAEKS